MNDDQHNQAVGAIVRSAMDAHGIDEETQQAMIREVAPWLISLGPPPSWKLGYSERALYVTALLCSAGGYLLGTLR
jgi:hypothetical protein